MLVILLINSKPLLLRLDVHIDFFFFFLRKTLYEYKLIMPRIEELKDNLAN